MTARPVALDRRGAPEPSIARAIGAWATPTLLVIGLAAVAALRWAGTRAGLDPLALGVGFGAGLVALAWSRPQRPAFRNIAIGAVAGLALVALTTAGAALAGTTLPAGLGRPAAPFLPWAAITLLVATGEEALLRGRLFDATRRAGGVTVAVLVTTVAFALLHVPLYGWHVVPLDLAVGLGFAGLRLLTRGIAAPAAAHAVADLATWWL
jgi:membrane protease YdiL (CAAX protease family)